MRAFFLLLFSASMSFILFTNCNSSKTVVVGQGESTTKKTTEDDNQLNKKSIEIMKLRNAEVKKVEVAQ